MVDESQNTFRPECFGDLQTVFPLGPDELRLTPEKCLRCRHKTPCLRSALGGGKGLQVREEMIERAYRGGMIGFFQRWSQKKSLQRMRKKDPSALSGS